MIVGGGAGGMPQGTPGGASPFPFIQVASDPSASPGRTAPVGTRAFLADGTAAWDKAGTADTDWVPVGSGSGGGSVVSVTAQDVTAIDNTDPTNPVILEATAANGGTIPAPQEAKLEGFASPGWFDAQAQFLAQQAANFGVALAAFDYLKVSEYAFGNSPLSSTGMVLTDASTPGGGLKNINTGDWTRYVKGFVVAAKSAVWAWSARAVLALPTSGTFQALGLVNAARSVSIAVLTQFATDPTHLCLSAPTGAGTTIATSFVADSNWHDFQVLHVPGAPGSVKLFMDGVQILSISDAALTDTDILDLGSFASAANPNTAAKFCYGYNPL